MKLSPPANSPGGSPSVDIRNPGREVGIMDRMNAVEVLKKNESQIKQTYRVKLIGVFGSFARGEEAEGSDVDILVEFVEGAKTFDNFMDLKFYLESLFGRKVDLVTTTALRPQLRQNILNEVMYA
jgi:hypothetical protein